MRLMTAPLFTILSMHWSQIQLVHHVADKVGQMPFGQPFAEARRE
jgi:hypothetical protein